MRNKNSNRRILITGLAKTGTTILFSRVRESLPTPLATFFEPASNEDLARIHETGRQIPTLTKCLSGHVADKTESLRYFSHHILIIRDPRDQFVSEMLYDFYKFFENNDCRGFDYAQALLKEKIRRPQSMPCSELFASIRTLAVHAPMGKPMVTLLANKYQELDSLKNALSPFVVRYEDIIDNQLEPLAAYLELSAVSEAEVDQDFKRVRRTGGYGEWRQWFTQEDIEAFEAELGPCMLRYQYDQHTLPREQVIPEETSLDYIRQFRPAETN